MLWFPEYKVCFHSSLVYFPYQYGAVEFLLSFSINYHVFSTLQNKRSRGITQHKANKKPIDMNSVCPSLQSHLPPEGVAIHAGLDVILVLSPGFGHQVGFSLLQTSPLWRLLLLGELLPHLLTDYLLQHTQKQRQQVTTDECTHCVSARQTQQHVDMSSLPRVSPHILWQTATPCESSLATPTGHFSFCQNCVPGLLLLVKCPNVLVFCNGSVPRSRLDPCILQTAMCVCVLLTGGIVEQLPLLPIVPSLSVLVLLCSAICRRLSESLHEKTHRKKSIAIMAQQKTIIHCWGVIYTFSTTLFDLTQMVLYFILWNVSTVSQVTRHSY